jgi:protein-S-isoprenylcysteine O-methyltransferase Ste14
VSVAVNMLAVFVGTLLAARAVSGALDGALPRRAWRLGAVAAVVLAVLPILSYGLSLVALSLLGDDRGVLGPVFGVGTYFGWPLFAVALAMGMGRVPHVVTRRPDAHLVRGAIRFVPVA